VSPNCYSSSSSCSGCWSSRRWAAGVLVAGGLRSPGGGGGMSGRWQVAGAAARRWLGRQLVGQDLGGGTERRWISMSMNDGGGSDGHRRRRCRRAAAGASCSWAAGGPSTTRSLAIAPATPSSAKDQGFGILHQFKEQIGLNQGGGLTHAAMPGAPNDRPILTVPRVLARRESNIVC
jgi:hypothetical protein